MGIPNRNYDRDKPNAGESSLSQSGRPLWSLMLKHLMIWVLIAILFGVMFHHLLPSGQNSLQPADNSFSLLRTLQSCESSPLHGTVHVYQPAAMRRTDVLYSGMEIRNHFAYPMVVLLTDATNDRRLLAASVVSDNLLQLSVPVGQYGMQILTGTEWCNLEKGFSDGITVSVAGGIAVNPGATTFMRFDGESLHPTQLALGYTVAMPDHLQPQEQLFEIIDSDKLELRQVQNGHYFSSGSINGAAVTFMIDTGATLVSISSAIAARANIQKCVPRIVSTANGTVNACLATAEELTFGSFRFTGIDVLVMPDMPTDALLGMNVLRNFRIEQADKVMRITAQ